MVLDGSQPTSAKDLNPWVYTRFSSVWLENSQFGFGWGESDIE
jgi:hypothetical protein